MSDDRLLTLPEIEQLSRVPVSTLRYYRHRGDGPPTFKLGRRVVAWESDVRRWMQAQRAAANADDAVAQRRERPRDEQLPVDARGRRPPANRDGGPAATLPLPLRTGT